MTAHEGFARGEAGDSAPQAGTPASSGPAGVLHVVQSGDRGGVQRHVLDLVRGLPECTAGVVTGTPGWLVDQLRRSAVPVTVVDLPRSLNPVGIWGAARQVSQVVQATRPATVHAHGVFALLACALRPLPADLVYTPHGFQWRDPSFPAWIRRLSRTVHRRYAPLATAVVAVSTLDAADAATLPGLSRRVRHIPNGVPLPAIPSRTATTQTVGVATRLVAGKGLEELCRAVARVPAARLAVAGTGPYGERLRLLAHEQLPGRADWLGWVDDLEPFFARLDVYVTLSRKEGLPYAVLDAMARGLPVVASDIPAHRELVTPGLNGFLVSPGDAEGTGRCLEDLLGHPEQRRAMGAASAQRAQDAFSLAAMCQQHRQLYADLWAVTDPAGQRAEARRPVPR